MAIFRFLSLFTLAGAIATPALAAPFLKPCSSASYIRPEAPKEDAVGQDPSWLIPTPTNSAGCATGLKVRAGPDLNIWRCQIVVPEGEDLKEGQSEYAFLIERKGAALIELADDLMAGAFHNFELIKVDLDGDGTKENILAAWNGQSNGIGIHRWTLHVFDARWALMKRFDEVADWGTSSLVAAPAGRQGCDIAITTYEESGGRTPHIVLQARFHTLSRQAAAPSVSLANDRPVLQRRLTNALVKQRIKWFEPAGAEDQWQWRGDVATWLNHPSTLSRPASS